MTQVPPPGQGKLEVEANQRIEDLKAKINGIQQELVTLEGKVTNRNPGLFEKLKKENAALGQRFQLVKRALFAIMNESYRPRTEDEAKLQYEVLRKATVEYCKKAKIDQGIWKSIES